MKMLKLLNKKLSLRLSQQMADEVDELHDSRTENIVVFFSLNSPITGMAAVSFFTSMPIHAKSPLFFPKNLWEMISPEKVSLQSKHRGFKSSGTKLISLSTHC